MTEILITATLRDLRFARICLASVRRFHPEAPVRILPGAPLPQAFVREVADSWNAGLYPLEPGEYGWGFVKLEPLFQEPGKRFLVLDADTILLGPVTQLFEQSQVAFLVDDETQPEEKMRGLYYDWDRVRDVDPRALRPRFVFNSGEWFGTSGVLTREDFGRWIDWTIPRKLLHPEVFMPGDQGILNYVINQKSQLDGLAVECRKIMRWPGHGLDDIKLEDVEANRISQIVHWAGYKAPWLETLPRADLLMHFEKLYYQRFPGGERLRQARARNAGLAFQVRTARTKAVQRMQRLLRKADGGDPA